MSVHLLTGRQGTDHITSADDGRKNAAMFGDGAYIIAGCECTMTNANTANVAAGAILLNGRFVVIDGNGANVSIDSGVVGQTRKDYIVARYEKNSSGIESTSVIVKKGGSGGAAPSYAQGNILNGDSVAEFPLYEINLDGITVQAPVKLAEAQATSVSRGGTGSTTAAGARSSLGLGTLATKSSLAASDIPNISASKITSGTLSADRIPGLNASKISAGFLPLKYGGTGGTDATTARASLGLADHVVESGTSGNWNYVKLNSGIAICAGRFTKELSCDDPFGPFYYASVNKLGGEAFPFKFRSNPANVIVPLNDGMMVAASTGPTTTAAGTVYAIHRSQTGTMTVTYVINAIGRV